MKNKELLLFGLNRQRINKYVRKTWGKMNRSNMSFWCERLACDVCIKY